jgi:hypothetical protein
MLSEMKKSHIITFLSILFVFVSLFVVWFSVLESGRQQDLRGQAYGTNQCAEAPINTQFRKWEAGTDKPWFDGKTIENYKLVVSADQPAYIDVNCFAKNGSALLQNPKIEIKRVFNNVTEIIPLQNPNVPELRKFALTKPGKYTFTCSNTAGTCRDADGFTIPTVDVKPPVTPTAEPSVTPSASPIACGSGQYAVSDVNKDCTTNIQDYSVFLQDYRQQTGL